MHKLLPLVIACTACQPSPITKKRTLVQDGALQSFPQAKKQSKSNPVKVKPRYKSDFLSCEVAPVEETLQPGFYALNCLIDISASTADWKFTTKRNGEEEPEEATATLSTGKDLPWSVSVQQRIDDKELEIIAESPSLGITDSASIDGEAIAPQRQQLEAELNSLNRGRLLIGQSSMGIECLRLAENGSYLIGDCETYELEDAPSSEVNGMSLFQLAEDRYIVQSIDGECLRMRDSTFGAARLEATDCPALNVNTYKNANIGDYQDETVSIQNLNEVNEYQSKFSIKGVGDTENLCLTLGDNKTVALGDCGSAIEFIIHAERVYKQ